MSHPFVEDCRSRLAAILEEAVAEGVSRGDAFTWSLGDTTTSVRFVESPDDLPPGAAIAVVDVRTTSERGGWDLDADRIAMLNAMAGLSAFVVAAREGDSPPLVSRVPLFGDDRMDADAAAALVFTTAVLQSAWLRGAAEWIATSVVGREEVERVLGEAADSPGLPLQDAPSRWTTEDFDALADELSSAGIRSVGGAGRLSARVGWKPGDAVLRMESKLTHPFLGNGLACSLQLPVALSAAGALEASSELNALESAGDEFPFLGAWCPDPSTPGHVAFTCFLPNCVFSPGLADAVAAWMVARAQAAVEWFSPQ